MPLPRTQAMENATKNCGEMITKLTLQMNKVRGAPDDARQRLDRGAGVPVFTRQRRGCGKVFAAQRHRSWRGFTAGCWTPPLGSCGAHVSGVAVCSSLSVSSSHLSAIPRRCLCPHLSAIMPRLRAFGSSRRGRDPARRPPSAGPPGHDHPGARRDRVGRRCRGGEQVDCGARAATVCPANPPDRRGPARLSCVPIFWR